MSFIKFLGKLFCKAPPSKHFSHDVVFSLFADQQDLQPNGNLFRGEMVNYEEKFASPFNAVF